MTDKELREVIEERWGDAVSFDESSKDLTLVVEKESLIEIIKFLKDKDLDLSFLTNITAVDWLKEKKRFEVVYHLYSIEKGHRLCVKVALCEDEPIPSVVQFYKAADWYEREVFDLFGIEFSGHPNLKRILLPDDWEGFAARKDYPLVGESSRGRTADSGSVSGGSNPPSPEKRCYEAGSVSP